jgi:hypothetical protein
LAKKQSEFHAQKLAKMRCQNRQLKKGKGVILVFHFLKIKKILVPQSAGLLYKKARAHMSVVVKCTLLLPKMASFHGSGVQISHFCPYETGTLTPFHEHLVMWYWVSVSCSCVGSQ